MSKREFKLLSDQGQVLGTYTGSCPYQAAMKAASKGNEHIMLREHYGNAKYGSKVHMYKGHVRALAAHELTPFAARHKISFKPEVRKVGMLKSSERKLGKNSDSEANNFGMDADEIELEKRCYNITEMDKCVAPCSKMNANTCYYGGL